MTTVSVDVRNRVREIVLTFLAVAAMSDAALAADRCSSGEMRHSLHDQNPEAVKVLEGQWAQAYANRDTALLNCILADDFEVGSQPDPKLELHNKHDVLQWVATRTGSAELDDLHITSSAPNVVARGTYSVRREGKLVFRFQFTDLFVYRHGRWQAIARILASLPLE